MSSFGESLRRERELRGITLLELSNATKVAPRYIEALERNQFDRLPGGVFNRGFVRAIARYMKLEENHWMSEYARAAGDEPEILARYAPPPPSTTPRVPARLGKWSYLVLVVAFAAGAYLVHETRMRRAAEASLSPSAAPPPASVSAPETPAPAATISPAPAVVSTAEPDNITTAPSAPFTATANDSSGELRLQVDVVEEAWVSVKVDDLVRYQGRMKPGQPRRFRAADRIEFTTANASAVVLTLNGETLPPLGNPGERRSVVLTANDLKPANP